MLSFLNLLDLLFGLFVISLVVNLTSNSLPIHFVPSVMRWGWFSSVMYVTIRIMTISPVESWLRGVFRGSRLSYLVAGLIGLLGAVAVWAFINRAVPDPPPVKIITVSPDEIDFNSELERKPQTRGLLKHEITVFNHTEEPYYQIWIKLVTESEEGAEFTLELPRADTQLGPVKVTSKAFSFLGYDKNHHRTVLVLIPKLLGKTPLSLRLAKVSQTEIQGPLVMKVSVLKYQTEPVPQIGGVQGTRTTMGTYFQFPEDGFQLEAYGMGFDRNTLPSKEEAAPEKKSNTALPADSPSPRQPSKRPVRSKAKKK